VGSAAGYLKGQGTNQHSVYFSLSHPLALFSLQIIPWDGRGFDLSQQGHPFSLLLWQARPTGEINSRSGQQYEEYQLSAIKYSGESIKNHEYFPEFEAKFEKPSDTK
jgi:hypothetical protein